MRYFLKNFCLLGATAVIAGMVASLRLWNNWGLSWITLLTFWLLLLGFCFQQRLLAKKVAYVPATKAAIFAWLSVSVATVFCEQATYHAINTALNWAYPISISLAFYAISAVLLLPATVVIAVAMKNIDKNFRYLKETV